MKARSTVVIVAAGVSILLAGFIACNRSPSPGPGSTGELVTKPSSVPTPVPITIISSVPSELNQAGGGAPAATMQQAAAFAWQEFIAVNWPAVKQTGGVVNGAYVKQRDVADNNCKFSDPNCTGPLVWETFRAKVEIFPGQPNFPANSVPPGYPSVVKGDDSFGYDALPAYNYLASVPACDSPAPTGTTWINLDETDQIGLDSMYAGNAPAQRSGNSSPQIIRFLAKANRNQYTYVASQGTTAQWWNALPPTVVSNTQAYLVNNMKSPPAGDSSLVSVPYGTVEAKAGWRILTDAELKSGRFQTATARYYENSPSLCYRQDTFGLVALHIIQKTPTAPYFIYATFEQADNILTPTGGRVEDQDGNINQPPPPCPSGQTAPCSTTPTVQLNDTATVSSPTPVPPQVTTVPPNASPCTPASQIYYINTMGLPGLPTNGPVCVNYRDNAIPPPVIQANQTAHAAIQSYLTANSIPGSPWLYYKLINVQYVPIDKNYAGLYTGPVNNPNTSQNASSYHQANIMVETNRTLQLFSGSLVGAGGTGANSDYASQFPEPSPFPTPPPSGSTLIHKQVYYNGSQYNMGGCMGCHASQGQDQGGDFSVILARGAVTLPEVPASVTSVGMTKIKRNRSLK